MMRLALVLLLTAAGCASTVPYRPERDVVRTIPVAKAREAVVRLFKERGEVEIPTTLGGPYRCDDVVVDDRELTYIVPAYLGGERRTIRKRLESLSPRGYQYSLGDNYFVWLAVEGQDDRERPAGANGVVGCIWFEEREDLETCLDALESLAAAARVNARPPR